MGPISIFRNKIQSADLKIVKKIAAQLIVNNTIVNITRFNKKLKQTIYENANVYVNTPIIKIKQKSIEKREILIFWRQNFVKSFYFLLYTSFGKFAIRFL